MKVSRDGTKVYVFCEQRLVVLDRSTLKTLQSIDLSAAYPDNPAFFNMEAYRIVLNSTEDTAYLLGVSNYIFVVDMNKG